MLAAANSHLFLMKFAFVRAFLGTLFAVACVVALWQTTRR